MSEHDEERAGKGREIKVTDRRMFTAEGELKEEYRHVGEAREGTAAESEPPASQAPPPQAPPEPERRGAGAAQPPGGGWASEPQAGPGQAAGGTPVEIPGTPPGLGPGFLDLVAALAEPVPVYLGDAELPDGRSAENLEAARFYIDLLDVLRQKTAGNLSVQESSMLEDLLYRLRMRYVQKRG